MSYGVEAIFLLLLGVNSLLAWSLVIYILRFRERERTTNIFAVLMGLVGVWTAGTLGEVLLAGAAQVNWAFQLHKLGGIGMYLVPPVMFWFALAYGGEERFFQHRRRQIAMCAPSILLLLTLLTNEWHQLTYTQISLERGTFFMALIQYERGPTSLANSLISYALLSIVLYFFFDLYFTYRTEQKALFVRQIRLILAWVLLIIIRLSLPVAVRLSQHPVSHMVQALINVSRPILLFVGLLVIIRAVTTTNLLEIAPIARDYVIVRLEEGFLAINQNLELVDWNHRTQTYLFPDKNVPVGTNVLQLLRSQAHLKWEAPKSQQIEGALREVLEGKVMTKRIELEVQSGKQPEQILELVISGIKKGGNGYLIGILRDVTKQKQAEALKESEQKFRRLVEQSLDGIALVAADGRIQFCNEAFTKLYGREEITEVEGRPIYELVPERYREAEKVWLRVAFQDERRPKLRFTIGLKDNDTQFDLEQKFQVINDPTTGTRLLQVVGRDVSVRMDLERHRAEFISMTSHELRTPLTVIRGFVELLKTRGERISSEDRSKYIQFIERNIQRIERLVGGVSTLGKIERGAFYLERQDIPFGELVAEALEPYQISLGNQIKIIGQHKMNAVHIEADAGRLMQVLDNLMENAINNSDPDHRRIQVEMEARPEVVQLTISDNGAGILPEDLDRIFEPFVSIPTPYNAQGTGIGLYLSQVIIETHGGTLTAHSKGKDQGAVFVLELPRVPGAEGRAE